MCRRRKLATLSRCWSLTLLTAETLQRRVSTLMWVTVLSVMLSVLLGGMWFFEVLESVGSKARQESVQLLQLSETLGEARNELHVQVRNWKNALLRSDEPAAFARNKADFHTHAAAVQQAFEKARRQALALGMDAGPIVALQAQHQLTLDDYAQAWRVIKPGQTASYKIAEEMTQGQYRQFLRALTQLNTEFEQRIRERVGGIGHTNDSVFLTSRFMELGALAVLLPLVALVAFLVSFNAMRQLGRADRRARTIFEAIGDAVVVVDQSGRVSSLNARAQQLMACTEAQAVGQPLAGVFRIVDMQTGQAIESPVQKVLRERTVVEMANGMQLIRPDNSQIDIEDSAAPLLDARGQLFGVVMVFHDVSERYATLRALNREHDLFEKTFNMAAVGMAHLSPAGQWTRVNNKLCKITGYSADELMRLSFQGITHPDDLGSDFVNIQRLLRKEIDIYRSEKRYVRKDGHIVWVAINVRVVWKDDGSPDFGVSVIEDIHSRKLAEQEAALAQQQYQALFEQMPEGIVLLDSELRVSAHNHEAMRQLGYTRERMAQLQVCDFEAQDDSVQIDARKRKIGETGRDDFESRYRRSDGSMFDVAVSVQLVRLPGDVVLFQTLFRDITAQKQAAVQIEHMAYHDQLTGLANRRLLHDRMTQAISSAVRRQAHLAVLYLDLDHFKWVNDSMGHPAGDALLLQVAQRLQMCVRAEDTVARVGGDEFVLMLGNIAHAEDAAVMADKLIAALSDPVLIHDEELRITPSIGISLCPQDGRDADELLKHADAALYQAKQLGRATYRFFTQTLNKAAIERLQIERLLHKALERNEFELYYQPQIELRTGRLVGCEALIRWNHPGMGQVTPGRFIPIAEHSGLINQIGRWVMQSACQQAKVWQDQGHANLKVSFNVSARQFMRPQELMLDLQAALACGVNPRQMSIELTESLLMNTDNIASVFQDIHAAGVQIALDDFGTGYSSLSYLRRFPIDVLKIDQSFVSYADQKPDDVEMVKTIIGMAHNLNMTLVAEGVESAAQAFLLTEQHCEVAQGYYFSRPVPLAQFDELLAGKLDFRPSQFFGESGSFDPGSYYTI